MCQILIDYNHCFCINTMTTIKRKQMIITAKLDTSIIENSPKLTIKSLWKPTNILSEVLIKTLFSIVEMCQFFMNFAQVNFMLHLSSLMFFLARFLLMMIQGNPTYLDQNKNEWSWPGVWNIKLANFGKSWLKFY